MSPMLGGMMSVESTASSSPVTSTLTTRSARLTSTSADSLVAWLQATASRSTTPTRLTSRPDQELVVFGDTRLHGTALGIAGVELDVAQLARGELHARLLAILVEAPRRARHDDRLQRLTLQLRLDGHARQ